MYPVIKRNRGKRDWWIDVSSYCLLLKFPWIKSFFPYPVITLELQDIHVVSDLLHKQKSVFWHKHWHLSYFQQRFQKMIYRPELPKGLWHYSYDALKCKECIYVIVPTDWLRWLGIDAVENVASIFTNAWNQLTDERITCLSFSVLHCLELCREDSTQLPTMVTWNNVWASSFFHSHGSSFPWSCHVITISSLSSHWATEPFFHIKGKLCL